MKKLSHLLCFFALAAVSLGCNPDESPDGIVEGEYVLVEVGSYMTDLTTQADELTYKETYTFRKDGSFVKSRTGSPVDGQATGTFTATEPESAEDNVRYFLSLDFNTGTEMINSCYPGEDIEQFALYKDGKLLNLAGSCDAPVLTYQKIN